MMKKKKIKIAGAGVAGLTSAINLAKADFKVEVYESCQKVGKEQAENPQMLPNWLSQGDVIEELEGCNIKINWREQIREIEIFLGSGRKILISGKKIPVGYTILRGGDSSLEKSLAQEAENLGVKIITNFEVKENDLDFDILATGSSQVLTLGYGQVFRGRSGFEADKTKVIFDQKLTPSLGYGYFYPWSQNSAVVKISKRFDEKISLKESLEKLKKEYLTEDLKGKDFLQEFFTKRSFQVPKSAKINNSLLVGERAGFQDQLFRFGIRYAVFSGYFAAKSIIENLDYDKLWKEHFLNEFQKIAKLKRIFQDLKRKNFAVFPEKLEIPIEKIKKVWLSRKIAFLLNFYPLGPNLIFNIFFKNLFSNFTTGYGKNLLA